MIFETTRIERHVSKIDIKQNISIEGDEIREKSVDRCNQNFVNRENIYPRFSFPLLLNESLGGLSSVAISPRLVPS